MKGFRVDKESGKLSEDFENTKNTTDKFKGFMMILNNEKSIVANETKKFENGLFAIKH